MTPHQIQMTPHRRLPHAYQGAQSLFVTWHLHGSLPSSRYPPPGKLSSGRAFVWIDRYLDTVRHGPMYLRQPEIARLVVASIQKGVELGHYDLYADAVMSNHVHLLIHPKIHPSRLLKSLKGVTARQANQSLGRMGEPFWQKESYDHWVRNDRELQRIRAYIENNPVKAGWPARRKNIPGQVRASRKVSTRHWRRAYSRPLLVSGQVGASKRLVPSAYATLG